MQVRVSRKLHHRNEGLPQHIASRPQVRLYARSRLSADKPKVIVTTATAREMVGFLWAITHQVQLGPAA
ncbi:hypothetical protein JIR23_06805 [Bradyrhizobium diazoefficiens]|nr:hypothetical protein [Bradyrhizobium diazoefficiens]QQN65456.1 hypothetical protein JIR23_06805 [Bradyrhizobium diazoefficiens]